MKFLKQPAPRLALLVSLTLPVFPACSSTAMRHSTAEFVSPVSSVVDGQTVVRPRASSGNQAPVYPAALRRAGVEGLVNVECVIDATGNVMLAQIESSTNMGLNQATLEAVRRWTFQPATRDGVPIPMRVTLPVGYQMAP